MSVGDAAWDALDKAIVTGAPRDQVEQLRVRIDAEALRSLHATYKNPPPETLAKLPKPTRKDNPKGKCNVCNGYHGLPAIHLDYMGHAEVTDALLSSDPMWTWEPVAFADNGAPLITNEQGQLTLWIRLTVHGVTRYGVGTCQPKPEALKELIGDATRNAAMRFGVGLGLWSKADGVDRSVEAGQEVASDEVVEMGDVTGQSCARCKQPIGDLPSKMLGGNLVHADPCRAAS